MAIYEGDPLVDIQTPDGRTIKLPRSIVPSALLPVENIAPGIDPSVAGAPGAQPPAPELAAPPTPSVTGGKLPTEDTQATTPAGAQPDVPVAPIKALTPSTLAASNKAYDKKQAVQAAAAASPEGQIQSALGEEKQAINDEADAAVQSADVDAAGQMVVGDIYKQRNEQLDKLAKQRQDQANADLAAQDKKAAEIVGLRQKIAATKIDRSADHPILAAIGVALAGIGSAMQHRYDGKSPDTTALELLFRSIDRKVAGQMADLDQQKVVLGLTKDELQTLKEKASSRLALNNLLVSAESERAARQVEETVARSSSLKVQAEGKRLAAQLRQKGAEMGMNAVQAQLQYEQREKFQKQDLGYKYAALSEQGREADNDIEIKREQIAADQIKALAAENARAGAESMKMMYEMQKDNETRGIGNIATGEPLLMKAGVEMLKQADAYDEEAKKLEASGAMNQAQQTRAQALHDKASQMRGEARIRYTFRERDPVQAGKVSDLYNSGQRITSLVDDIKMMYDDTGRSYLSTNDKQAAIQSKVTELMMQLKDAWQLGVLSKQDTNLINQATGGDPTRAWNAGNVAHAFGLDVGTDPEAFKKRLDSLADGVEKTVYGKLKADQYDGDSSDLFHRKTAPEASPQRKAISAIEQDKTPLERENIDRERGGTAKGFLYGPGYALHGTTPEREANKDAQQGSLKYPGLSEKQGEGFDTLLNSYKAGDKRTGDLIVQQATNTRPALSLALMHSLRNNAPDLYAKARSGVAPDVAKQLDYEEKSQIGPSLVPTTLLVQQVLTNPEDEQGKAELVRRATTGKDKEAQRALKDIIMSKNGKR